MRKARPGLQGSAQYQGAPLRIRTAFSWFGHDRGPLETNALGKVVELLSQQESVQLGKVEVGQGWSIPLSECSRAK